MVSSLDTNYLDAKKLWQSIFSAIILGQVFDRNTPITKALKRDLGDTFTLIMYF